MALLRATYDEGAPLTDRSTPSRTNSSDEEEGEEMKEEEIDDATVKPYDFESDTYGMTIVALIRDSYFLARSGKGAIVYTRYIRLGLIIALCLLTIGVQMFLLLQVKQFVCARSVKNIRESYDLFETTIYGKENCTLSPHGHHRGDLTKFSPSAAMTASRLSTLKDSDQDDVCHIPLSQPHFFGVILGIWTLTCVGEMKKAWHMGRSLMNVDRIDNMANALVMSGDSDFAVGAMNVVGLTFTLQMIFVVLACIRLSITAFLLWVGCRWLLATNDFEELILNAVALEFILLLKNGFYMTLVPFRNQLDLEITKIRPRRDKISAGLRSFAGTFWLLAVTISWVVIYMVKLQTVLPDYKWDIHHACAVYIKNHYVMFA